MKIAVIAGSQVPASTANSIQAMKVCQSLAQLGNDVCLWVPGSAAAGWVELSAYYGLSTAFDVRWLKCIPQLRRYDLAWSALNQAQRWNANVVYTWMPQAAVFALWRGMPALLEMHMLPSGSIGPRLFHQFIKARGKKRLLCITAALRQQLETQYGALPAQEVQISPMGVEPERYFNLPDAASARRQLGLPEGFTVGYTGHFYPGRGMDILLELAAAFPQVNFLWVGGRAQDVEDWRSRLKTGGINNVTLTGFIKNQEIPVYQAAAEVLLMPYGQQVGVSSSGNTAGVCSPMKMFDYMAAGRAIISSDLPVLHEVLSEDNAIFCPPEDAEAWKAALYSLITDEARRQKLAQQAFQDVQQYSWVLRAARSLEDF